MINCCVDEVWLKRERQARGQTGRVLWTKESTVRKTGLNNNPKNSQITSLEDLLNYHLRK